MLFSFTTYWIPTILFLTIYTVWHLFDAILFGTVYQLDLFSRFNLSDSIINWFNFYWTSNLYLSLVFFFVFISIVLLTQTLKKTYSLGLFFIFFLWFLENSHFLVTNNTYISSNLLTSEVNTLLTNNLNKYHPLILYIGAFSLPVLTYCTFINYRQQFLFEISSCFFFFQKLLLSFFVVIFGALFLGSWWALQEGTWGGWWNWDASEVLGLLVFIFYYVELHLLQTFYKFNQKFQKLLIFTLLILISYYFIQLNFELTSHSFGTRFNHFFNNHFFFLQMITVLLTWTMGVIIMVFWTRIQNQGLLVHDSSRVHTRTPHNYLLLLVTFLIVTLIFFSYTPLINYFFWQFFKFNSFNWLTSIEFTTWITMLLLLIFFKAHQTFLHKLGLSLVYFNVIILWPLLGLMNFRQHSFFVWTHLIVVVFFINCLINPSWQLAYTWAGLYPFKLFDATTIITSTTPTFTCQNFFVDVLNTYTSNFVTKTGRMNFFYKTNSLKLNEFYLYLNADVFIGCFLTGNNTNPHLLLLELPSFTTLVECCWLFLLLVLLQLKHQPTILNTTL